LLTLIVLKAKERGWDTLGNGKLPAAAELDAFDVLVTDDKNIARLTAFARVGFQKVLDKSLLRLRPRFHVKAFQLALADRALWRS
jgi:hypothetical protein